MDHALDKLEVMGDTLPFPHQSAVRDAKGIRELRPRSGRSPWRGFYSRVGDTFVLLGIGPEAEVNALGFRRAVQSAGDRLKEVSE